MAKENKDKKEEKAKKIKEEKSIDSSIESNNEKENQEDQLILDIKQKPKKNKNSKDKKDSTFKIFMKDFGLSFVKTESLFKFAHRNGIYAFIALLIIISYLIFTPFLPLSKMNPSQELTNSRILYANEAISQVLKKDLPCSIKNNKLVCDKLPNGEKLEYNEVYSFINKAGREVKYDLYVNISNLTEYRNDAESEYFKVGKSPKNGDNYLVFHEDSIQIRYVDRDYDNGTWNIRKVSLLYDKLNGLNFHQIYNEAKKLDTEEKQNEYFSNEATNIIDKSFTSILEKAIFSKSLQNGISTIFLFLLAALVIRGRFLFVSKKGFRYTQCLKITMIGALQSLVCTLPFLLMGANIISIFGLFFTIRMLYIWIRYTSSKKNTEWLKTIYKETKDERFNLSEEKA